MDIDQVELGLFNTSFQWLQYLTSTLGRNVEMLKFHFGQSARCATSCQMTPPYSIIYFIEIGWSSVVFYKIIVMLFSSALIIWHNLCSTLQTACCRRQRTIAFHGLLIEHALCSHDRYWCNDLISYSFSIFLKTLNGKICFSLKLSDWNKNFNFKHKNDMNCWMSCWLTWGTKRPPLPRYSTLATTHLRTSLCVNLGGWRSQGALWTLSKQFRKPQSSDRSECSRTPS